MRCGWRRYWRCRSIDFNLDFGDTTSQPIDFVDVVEAGHASRREPWQAAGRGRECGRPSVLSDLLPIGVADCRQEIQAIMSVLFLHESPRSLRLTTLGGLRQTVVRL